MDNKQNITLRQGLENFHRKHDEYLSHNKEGATQEVKSFFKSHDIAHVLFECDISLFGEGAVKIWTIFGTTLGFWDHLSAYRKASAFELSKRYGVADYVKNIFKLIFSIPKIMIRAGKMNRPWPWSGFESYLDVPIHEIRKEFNIRVIA